MSSLTKFALKRPVTMVLVIITAFYFGLSSIFSSPMELTPDMELPMMMVMTTYVGASPDDVCELVSKPIAEQVSTLEGIDTVIDYSMENVSIISIQYNYGTNLDKAYINLKKAIDIVRNSLPDGIDEPTIMSININETPVMYLSVSGGTDGNLYSYVESTIVPELEKISYIGEVSISGGQADYIRIQLDKNKMEQYGLTMTTLVQLIGAADYTVPAGTTSFGDREYSVSFYDEYKSANALKNVVIPLASGDIIHLSDVADVSNALEDATSIARFDGEDVVTLSISKQQDASAISISADIKEEMERLKAANPTLDYLISYDSSDDIKDALKGIYETLIQAVILAMIILFIFFGDIKASLIVGSSIPISVLISLVCMSAMGFTLNIISVGALVLGVGMIVDNSIVVIESCFRKKEEEEDYFITALEGTKTVIEAIFGSTTTTCVVFVPLALLAGLSGQLFKQLGFTIVFCMMASFFSAVTVAPMMYYFLRPKEKENTPASKFVLALQNGYRKLVRGLIPRHRFVITVSVILLLVSIGLMVSLGTRLMPSVDQGMISITASYQSGLDVETIDENVKPIEEIIMADPDVEDYLLTYGGSGTSSLLSSTTISAGNDVSITVYLKSDRSRKTATIIEEWKKSFSTISNTTITVSNGSSNGLSMLNDDTINALLFSTDMEELKRVGDELASALHQEDFITKPHHSMENASSVVKIKVDPVKASSYGLTPASIGATMYANMSGTTVKTFTVDGKEYSVKVEYPDDEFDNINKIQNHMLTTAYGTQVRLGDIAEVTFEDSAQYIQRQNKMYALTITGEPSKGYEGTASDLLTEFVENYEKPASVSVGMYTITEMIYEELGALAQALVTAVFLVFIVMAMQFESPKFSLIVMLTIPFSMIGAGLLLFIANCKIDMISMIGFLMMVGTVVNNAILYVDTANQMRADMDLRTALVEAGALRIRPILMTTLTTIIAMIPLCLAIGESGQLLQGLALVNVGGLVTSTILALILLPTVCDMTEGA